jgi:hypothetical protein
MTDIYENIKNGKYKSSVEYPTHYSSIRSLEILRRAYRDGILNDKEYEVKKVDIQKKDLRYKADRSLYETDERNKLELFKKDALEETDLTDHPKKDMAYRMAWERGHSSGLESVVNELYELTELLKD